MAAIKLTAEQIGNVTGSGEEIRHEFPALDCFGKPYERKAASTRYVAERMFVVIPPGADGDHLTFDVGDVAPKPANQNLAKVVKAALGTDKVEG